MQHNRKTACGAPNGQLRKLVVAGNMHRVSTALQALTQLRG